ncbi:MAG: hypothetical protein IT457_18750 [Planctomycetes bacterium]|nr:hypothetical protein [Planctomycetota bacterium]
MGLINWIFDFYQQSRIERLRDEIALRSNQPQRSTIDVDRLERAIGELALAVKTVQRLAVEKGLCSAAEFQRKLEQIDAEDGQRDGRSTL